MRLKIEAIFFKKKCLSVFSFLDSYILFSTLVDKLVMD